MNKRFLNINKKKFHIKINQKNYKKNKINILLTLNKLSNKRNLKKR